MEERYLTFYRRLALVGGIACCLLLLFAGFREEWFVGWRKYQKEYRDLTVQRAVEHGDSIMVPGQTGIAEITLQHVGLVDRCITCHQGIEDTLCAGVVQPLGFHSGAIKRLRRKRSRSRS